MATVADSTAQDSVSAGRKRKPSNTESGTSRTTKYRASQACQYCRARKVRCDVLINTTGCTNCRLDNQECVVLASRRGKTDRHHDKSSNDISRSTLRGSIGSIDDPRSSVKGEDSYSQPRDSVSPQDSPIVGDVPVTVTFDDSDGPDDIERRITNDEYSIKYTPSGTHDGTGPAGLPTQDSVHSSLPQHASPAGVPPLPSFITPIPNRLSVEDAEYLTRKGVFTLPEPELRIEILRSYIFCLYPFMPILDLKPFVESVMEQREDGCISLLLFHAVMFAGVSSLEQHMLRRLGYETAKEARDVFFTRVKVLYEANIEQDGIATFQALLLMSSWLSKEHDWKDTWHWAGLAHLAAQNLGLHREPNRACGSDKIQHLRRRLWWGFYIRDRMLALGTRRSRHIREEEFNVKMLTLEDFDLDITQNLALTPDAEEQKHTALMCIEMAKLCGCIDQILSLHYTTLTNQPNVPHSRMVVSRRDSKPNELEICDKRINEWYRSLSPELQKSAHQGSSEGFHSCSDIHWAILNLAHLSLIIVLHRVTFPRPLPENSEARAIQLASRSKVKDAARSVTKITQTMLHRDQVRFLGLYGITALIAACLSHLNDIRSGDEDVRDASIFRFHQSLQILEAMKTMYWTADFAVSFLLGVIRKSDLPMSTQVAIAGSDIVSSSTINLAQRVANVKRRCSDTSGLQERIPDSTNLSPTTQKAVWDGYQPQMSHYPHSAVMLDLNRPHLSGGGDMHSLQKINSADSYGASMSAQTGIAGAGDTSMGNRGNSHFINSAPGHYANPATQDPYMDMNGGQDVARYYEPMAVNYDFFTETFGFFDGQLQGP